MSARPPPRIVYLDQNKWIELLKAEKSPRDYPVQFAILKSLTARWEAGEIVLPLSSANIYETYKIGDPERRRTLATLQASLSGGYVFRGRYRRLEVELSAVLSRAGLIEHEQLAEWWFLSEVFLEAFSDVSDEGATPRLSERVLESIRRNPATALFNYLTTAPDDLRIFAVTRWSDGAEALRARIETRRQRHHSESLAMRRRIYNVLMFADDVELLVRLAAKRGIHWNSVDDIGSSLARRLVNEMPIYHSERELALRLEAMRRPIAENDFRDVQTYCAAIPYADVVIGENLLINLARQARLGLKYDTRLETDLVALAN